MKQFGESPRVSAIADGALSEHAQKLKDVDFEGKMREVKGEWGRTAA